MLAPDDEHRHPLDAGAAGLLVSRDHLARQAIARQERAAFTSQMNKETVSAANIDATTKVVIPQVVSLAVA